MRDVQPPFRRTENFAYTECLLLDFDHLADKGVSRDELRKRVAAGSRVMMCITSTNKDGLKVMFFLGERCYNFPARLPNYQQTKTIPEI